MRPSRKILGSFVLAPLLAIALATSALASTVYTLTGFETSLTKAQPCGDVSTFAGVAWTGGDYGTWTAAICHTPLTTSAQITGGLFSYKGAVRSITGNFDAGGSVIQRLPASTGCTKQVYDVNGSVSGTASFIAVLTHYRTWLFGRCIVYAATVTGTFSF